MSRIGEGAVLLAKLVALTVLLLITSALGAQLLPATEGAGAEGAPPEGSQMAVIVAILFLQVVVLAYPIVRSRWGGMRLTVSVAVLFFGTVTFLNQIESLVYLRDKMPAGMTPGLFAMGLINALVFAPIAVLLLGRWPTRETTEAERSGASRIWPRLALAGLVMLALYYLFGYYVAWQSPNLREYYGGTDPGSFVAQMVSVAKGTPWMLPLQYLRGLGWAALALLVVRSMKGGWWEAGLATAMLFTVPALYLLFPNPLMPEEVRMTHLVETAPYQFLFGWFAAWFLRNRRGGVEGAVARPARSEQPAGGGV